MTVWYTADLHFGHAKVAQLREFADVDVHDNLIACNWGAKVRTNDIVYVLGDIAVSNPTRALEILHNLPGRKHLIVGNHDACHPMHREAHKWQAKYFTAFESVQPYARRRIGGMNVLMSHFPYAADRGETRYPQYRLPDLGEFLLHGHTHSDRVRTSDHEIHVGLDTWGLEPVREDVIADLIAELNAPLCGDLAPVQGYENELRCDTPASDPHKMHSVHCPGAGLVCWWNDSAA
jgi:calcineurin-like phosphoesterase family protein